MRVATRPVLRERLIQRVLTASPAILWISAPAGFGKSTLLAQLRPLWKAVLCDCSGVRDDLDLARRLFPEMADTLEDGGRTAADRLALALERFGRWDKGDLMIDSAESIARSGSALQFFTRLLESRPPGIRLAIASRDAFPIRFTRFVSPHELLALRATDIAFERAELDALFRERVLEERQLEEIDGVCAGWPVAALLLRRLAVEERLPNALARIRAGAFEELHDYIADEIFASLDERTLQSLFVCAVVPHAVARDVCDVYDNALSGEELAEMAREWPFLMRNAQSYEVHALIASALRDHQDQRRLDVLNRLASLRSAENDFERAAQLLLECGDRKAAAATLARFEGVLVSAPSSRYRALLASFDDATLRRYPRLWSANALTRLYREPSAGLSDECESLWRTLDRDTPLPDRMIVLIVRILLMAYCGRGPQALEETEAAIAPIPSGTPIDVHAQFLLAFVHARAGLLVKAKEEIDRVLPFADAGDVIAAAAHLTLATDIARVLGDRMEEQFLTLAATRAQEAGLSNLVALVQAHRLFSAWFHGNERAVFELARELEVLVEAGVRGFAYFSRCARGRETEPDVDDVPEFVVYGHLVALARSHDDARRMMLANKAHEVALRLELPFVEALTAVAVAHCNELLYEEFRARAHSAAQRVESPVFQQAIKAAFEDGADTGMLTPFLSNLRRTQVHSAPLEVGMWTGRVLVDGAPVSLGRREFELLLALSLRREGVSRTRLAAQLWPDLDEASAKNSMSVCLHRLRGRLVRGDLVERTDDGYRVHDYSAVTLWRLERVAPVIRSRAPLRDRDRMTLERLWEELCEESTPVLAQFEWFEPTLRRLREASTDIGRRLGYDALNRGNVLAALWYAESALVRDPCDEAACEIAIRANLAFGDRAAAMRVFRRYREALKLELATEPSRALVELFSS